MELASLISIENKVQSKNGIYKVPVVGGGMLLH